MSRFSYEVVETVHGQKLVIGWSEDGYPDGIKDLPWDQTHRSMYNPEWDDCDEKIVHGKVDYTCWYIDHTERSISLFEDKFNVYVPAEYKPGDGVEGEVDIVVPEGYSKFFIESGDAEVDTILDAELSYEAPNAEYTRAYKNGTWDGINHIYNMGNRSAPLGLLDRCVSLLEDEGYEVDVDWEDRTSAAQPFEADWNDDYELRHYQRGAVDALIDNEGGVINLPTGTGKTVTAAKLIDENSVSRGRALVIVHTQELLYQWQDEIKELLGIEPGIIGDGHWSEGDVTIAIIQTLESRGTDQLANEYGQIIFDECHRTSAAETFHEIGMDLECQYRVGLSATPWRRISGEELYIEGAVGDIVYEVSAEDMIEQGYLTRPIFSVIDPAKDGSPQTPYKGEDYHDAFQRCIETDPVRNASIAKEAARLADKGHKVLVNVNRIAQGRIIAAALNGDLDDGDVLEGLDPDKQQAAQSALDSIGMIDDLGAKMVSSNTNNRAEVLDEFENGELDVVCSTLLKEGVDIPNISAIILAHGGKSDIESIQTIGRALRPSDVDHAEIVDVKDEGRYFNKAYKERQQTMRSYYGEYYDLDVDAPETEDDDTEQRSLTEPLTDEEMDEMEAWLTGTDE